MGRRPKCIECPRSRRVRARSFQNSVNAGIVRFIFCFLLFSQVALAQTEQALTPREQELLKKVEALEQRVSDLEKAKEPPSALIAAPAPELENRVKELETAAAESAKKKPANAFNAFWKDGLRFETDDGNFKLKIGGKLAEHVTWISEDDDVDFIYGDIEDAAEFRKARLGVMGELYEQVVYRAEYDFAPGTPDFRDVYIALKGLPVVGAMRVGHFKEPFSLEELTVDDYPLFDEKSLLNAFAPQRNLGIMFTNTLFKERMTWAAGVFKDTDVFSRGMEDGNYNVTARVTGLPWYEEDGHSLIHLGAAASFRDPVNEILRYRSRPEQAVGPFLVDTRNILARDVYAHSQNLYGAELAAIYGPLTFAAEYAMADVDVFLGDDATFDAYYLSAAYFLTGETRPYDKQSATFTRVRPKKNFDLKNGDWGAWEVALRNSALDLDSNGIWGGKLQDWTLALNWYLNPYTRMTWSYTHADRNDIGDADFLTAWFQVDF